MQTKYKQGRINWRVKEAIVIDISVKRAPRRLDKPTELFYFEEKVYAVFSDTVSVFLSENIVCSNVRFILE